LEDISVEDMNPDSPLFGEGLGLDSIDALELIVLLEKNYGIKIEDPKKGKKYFIPSEAWLNTLPSIKRLMDAPTDIYYRFRCYFRYWK